MRGRLSSAAEDSERARIGAGQVLRGDGRRGRRTELAERVGLDDRLEPRVLEREQHDEERRTAGQPQERLQPRVTELVVDARHDGEDAAGHLRPDPRGIVDHTAREPVEARLDGRIASAGVSSSDTRSSVTYSGTG